MYLHVCIHISRGDFNILYINDNVVIKRQAAISRYLCCIQRMFLGRKLAAGRDVMTCFGGEWIFHSNSQFCDGMQVCNPRISPQKKGDSFSSGAGASFKVYCMGGFKGARCLMDNFSGFFHPKCFTGLSPWVTGNATARFLQASRLEVLLLKKFSRKHDLWLWKLMAWMCVCIIR